MTIPELSIVVPVYNGASTLNRTLASLFRSVVDARFEVIVVDDGSSDNTAEIAKNYSLVLLKNERNMGVAYSRNRGARKAHGAIVLFCDADVVFAADTLQKVVDEFKRNPELEILNLGLSTRSLQAGWLPSYLAFKAGFDYLSLRRDKVNRVKTTYIQSLAVAFKANCFREYEFDPAFKAPGGEEYELGHRISTEHTIWLYPSIQVDHDTKDWRRRLTANFVRSARWAPLFFARRCRFEGATGVATPRRAASSALSTVTLTALALSWAHGFFAALAAAALLAKLLVARDFYTALSQQYGRKTATFGFFFEIIYESAFAAGFAWGVPRAILAGARRRLTDSLNAIVQLKFLYTRTPPHLVWFCTSVCNQACQHCFYWDKLNSGVDELSQAEIEKISQNLGHIKYLTLTGGEPSARRDIVDCIEIFYRNNGLQQVGFHTNGMLPDKIRKISEDILERCPKLVLLMSVSIDHFREQHDRLRGAPGAYEKALQTVTALKPLRRSKNFYLCVNSVYCADNQDVIWDLHRFVTQELKVDHALGLVRGKPKQPALKNIDLGNYKQLVEAIAASKSRGDYAFANMRRLVDDATKAIVLNAAEHGRFSFSCTAGRKTIVLSETGELYPCEILPKPFGNVKDFDYNPLSLLRSKAAKAYTREIVESKCFCTWECIQPNNLIFNKSGLIYLAKIFWRRSLGKSAPPLPRGTVHAANADPRQ